MDQTEKVRILLAEYGSLRSEIIARMNHGYQLLSVAVAAIAFLVTFQTGRWIFIAAGVIAIIFLIACWFVWRDLHKLARRVRQIELDVNTRAGEQLLIWETAWGGLATNYWIGRPEPAKPPN